MSKKHRTIHVIVYKAKAGIQGVATGENGKIVNENHMVKMSINTMEWDNWLKYVKMNGIIKIDAIGLLKENYEIGGDFKYDEVPENIKLDIHKAVHGNKEVKLTPEQKEIADLKKKVDELLNQSGKKEAKKEKVEVKKEEPKKDVNEDLSKAREEYQSAFDKKGHHSWDAETIREKIKNK